MAPNDEQVVLDRLLGELRSNDPALCLNALQELDTLHFSSPAILRELEKLALRHTDEEVRTGARRSLVSPVHTFIRSRVNRLNRPDRAVVLREIEQWEKDGLLEPGAAGIIRTRYSFDLAPAAAVPVPAAVAETAPPPQPVAAGPRPSLTQTLLSEASIKVYLYLGAFFVIASALILAALVEAARLPILTGATLAFGGAALLLHRRLPQPSFALFIVFSFLLPIDANVLEETFGLTGASLSSYWTIVLLALACIWSYSAWFYGSRFFSAVAFGSLSLAFYRAGEIFHTGAELQVFFGMLASLAGLAGASLLEKWKDRDFSLPVFSLAQLQVLGCLAFSLVMILGHVFGSGPAGGGWLLIALAWLAAATFYVWSDQLRPGFGFPWLAAAVLLPLPWFLLNTFEAARPMFAYGFWIWGALFALSSEAVRGLSTERSGKYHWPLLAGSLPLFLTSFTIILLEEEPIRTFGLLVSTALVYGLLHLLRPRWYVWSAALLAALFAYFTFFTLPAVDRLGVPVVYQILIASALLVIPELLTGSPLSLRAQSRWPMLALGTFISLLGITLALADLEHAGRGALVLVLYAVLFSLHALHSNRRWLVYFAAASASLALVYALAHFELDLWLPALTLLSMLFYGAGIFLRRSADEMKDWGYVLIDSGLGLGTVLSAVCLVLMKEAGGWYVGLIALLFAVELFARPLAWLEPVVETLLSASLFLILNDLGKMDIGHFLFGASLIWLGGDLLFGRLLREKRLYRPAILSAGYTLLGMAVFAIWGQLSAVVAAIYFLLYAVFFAGTAILQNEPRLGYFTTAFLPLAVIQFSNIISFDKWIFPLIVLSAVYYAAGYWLRRSPKPEGWDQTLLYSGLGLGTLTSLSAPFQGGLDSSIPVAVAATLFAAEAFARRDVWWALPADGLYLMSYFMILIELDVDEPQFFSIGAALLGMLMHVLLTRAGSKTGAFIAGMLSQLVLLGTTYIQMVSTERLSFFFLLFVQSMIVLVYGLVQRSRSLVITPIAFAVLGVVTVVYSALRGLGPVILIGSTGLVLLLAGIVAVLMRERITKLGEQLSEWKP